MRRLKQTNEELETNGTEKISETKIYKTSRFFHNQVENGDEYVKTPIASDSKDEKRISNSQTKAERNV